MKEISPGWLYRGGDDSLLKGDPYFMTFSGQNRAGGMTGDVHPLGMESDFGLLRLPLRLYYETADPVTC